MSPEDSSLLRRKQPRQSFSLAPALFELALTTCTYILLKELKVGSEKRNTRRHAVALAGSFGAIELSELPYI